MRAGNGASAAALAEAVAARSRWADLGTRSASTLVLAPLAILAIWFGGWAFAALVALAGAGLAWEWVGLCRRLRGPRSGWASGVAGLAWIALWAAALIWLRADPQAGRGNVIGLALIVWGTDIGAYMVGRSLGGWKLAPAISPGKTWSGAIGGAAVAAVIAVLMSQSQPTPGPFAAAAILGVFLSVLGQAGDLAESAFKRRCGVKDSGRLIPGHGGVLDRLDATLAVVPIAALLSLASGHGVILWQ